MFGNSARLAFTTLFTILTAAFISFVPRCVTAQDVDPGDFVLRYDSTDGNLTVHYLGTTAVDIYFIDIITLGDGSIGTATGDNLGLLSRSVVAPSYGTNDTLNNDVSGANGRYSQVFYSNNFGLSKLATFDSANNTLNVGDVGQTGWTQADINNIFVTDDSSYVGLNPGHFGYSTADADFIGKIEVTPVPEPSALLLAGTAVASGGLYQVRRRRTSRK